MQEAKLLLEQIFISKKTITEMMVDRGYINANPYLPFNIFYETFKDMDLNNINFSLDMVFVKLNDDIDVNFQEIEKNQKIYEEIMSSDNIQDKIYVKYLFNNEKPNVNEVVKNFIKKKLLQKMIMYFLFIVWERNYLIK